MAAEKVDMNSEVSLTAHRLLVVYAVNFPQTVHASECVGSNQGINYSTLCFKKSYPFTFMITSSAVVRFS